MTKEGNEGKSEIQKFEYLENEKNFLGEVKSIFHNYLTLRPQTPHIYGFLDYFSFSHFGATFCRF